MNATEFEFDESSPDFDGNDDDGNEPSDEMWMMVLWFFALIMFLLVPICSNKKRRSLCMRRLRERRWIRDEDEFLDDWYRAAIDRRNARQRQMQAQQEQFQTSRTQEDEIREQFMLMAMEKYTTVSRLMPLMNLFESCMNIGLTRPGKILDKSDIHEIEQSCIDPSTGSSCKDNVGSVSATTEESDSQDETAKDIEKGTPGRRRTSSMFSEDDEELEEMDLEDTNEILYVPLAGSTCPVEGEEQGKRRQVLNGCAICLTPLVSGEKLIWASNPECSHVFHHSCILHWFHASGRKTQKRRLRQNPNMTDTEALESICKFPMNCPCCRQTFCLPEEGATPPKGDTEDSSDSEGQSQEGDASRESGIAAEVEEV